jgi:indole-3-glycerol phosphate synthase
MKSKLDEMVESMERDLKARELPQALYDLLAKPELKIFSGFKRRSPSKGAIALDADPVKFATRCLEAGTDGLYVITNERFFGGSLEDVRRIRTAHPQVVILTREWIVHPRQVAEAVAAGASAVLLIVAILQERLKAYMDLCAFLGVEAVVEVLNEHELEQAIACGAQIVLINNRCLHTFKTDLSTGEQLAPKVPKGIKVIGASGIASVDDARRLQRAGCDGVILASSLLTADNPETLIRQIKG